MPTLSMVVAALLLLGCLFGLRRESYREGFEDGMTQGAVRLLAEISVGHVAVVDGRLIFDENSNFAFFDGEGNRISEVDLDELDFVEE